jgi:hypothetical protein
VQGRGNWYPIGTRFLVVAPHADYVAVFLFGDRFGLQTTSFVDLKCLIERKAGA